MNFPIAMTSRQEPARSLRWLSPALALLLTVVAGAVIFATLGKDPVEALVTFFISPLDSLSGWAEVCVKMTPLLLCIMGREILQNPGVLIVNQPTWGVDVGAAATIRNALMRLREDGAAVLVVSEEVDELFEICDRIAVMYRGHLSPAVPKSEMNIEIVGRWMSGLWPDGPAGASGHEGGEA